MSGNKTSNPIEYSSLLNRQKVLSLKLAKPPPNLPLDHPNKEMFWKQNIVNMELSDFLLMCSALELAFPGYIVDILNTVCLPDQISKSMVTFGLVSELHFFEIVKLFHYHADYSISDEACWEKIPELVDEDGKYNILSQDDEKKTVKNALSQYFVAKPKAKSMTKSLSQAVKDFVTEESQAGKHVVTEEYPSLKDFQFRDKVDDWKDFETNENPMTLCGQFSTATITFFHHMGPGCNYSEHVPKNKSRGNLEYFSTHSQDGINERVWIIQESRIWIKLSIARILHIL